MISVLPSDYVACICEGPSEVTIVNLLLEKNALIFTREQLLDGILPVKFRAAKKFRDQYLTMDYGSAKVAVFVIQDRALPYKIDPPYCYKIHGPYVSITAPEIEMLMIHSLGLHKAYNKQKQNKKPSVFLAEHLQKKTACLKSKDYITDFYNRYDLVQAIRHHKRICRKLPKPFYYLADLLR